jgi:hypothetical protein
MNEIRSIGLSTADLLRALEDLGGDVLGTDEPEPAVSSTLTAAPLDRVGGEAVPSEPAASFAEPYRSNKGF